MGGADALEPINAEYNYRRHSIKMSYSLNSINGDDSALNLKFQKVLWYQNVLTMCSLTRPHIRLI